MPATIKIVFDLTDGSWRDLHLQGDKVNGIRPDVEYLGPENSELFVGRMPGGMKDSGNASLFIRVNRPNGSVVLIETSLKVFVETAKVMNSLDQAEKMANGELDRIAHKPPDGG